MKNKPLICLLAAEVIMCVLISALKLNFRSFFTSAIAFPFEQIGLGLRALSLSGTVENAAAVVIYAAVCLVPSVFFLFRLRRGIHGEDWLLPLLSALLFYVVYVMINPGAARFMCGGSTALVFAILGGTVYSVLIAYGIMRILRLFYAGNLGRLKKYMALMLAALSFYFVYMIAGACFGELLSSLADLQRGNTGAEGMLGTSRVFLVLRFIVDALPYVFDLLIALGGIELIRKMNGDTSEGAVESANALARLCSVALVAAVGANIAINVLQLLFAEKLFVISSIVQLPLISIAFVLAVLLLCRLLGENRRLKEDSDSII